MLDYIPSQQPQPQELVDPYQAVGSAAAQTMPEEADPFAAVGQAAAAQGPSAAQVAAAPEQDPFAAVGAAVTQAIPPGAPYTGMAPMDLTPNNIELPVPKPEMYVPQPLPRTPTYDEAMGALKGPVPTPDKLVMGWNDPQHKTAVEGFRSALMANFLQAGAEGAQAMTGFFGTNPYAYMLGLAQDEMANAVQNLAIKNGMDDPYANQYLNGANIIDAAQLVAGITREQATGKFGANEAYLKQTFLPYLSKMPARVQQSILSMGGSLAQGNPDFMNALANMDNAKSNALNATTNSKAQALTEREYNEIGRRLGEEKINLTRAQTDQTTQDAIRIAKEAGYMGREKEVQIAYTQSLAELNNATRQYKGMELALQGMEAETREYQTNQMVINNVAESAWKDFQEKRQEFALKKQNGEFALTKEEQAANFSISPREKEALAVVDGYRAKWAEARRKADEYAQRIADRVGSGVAPEFNVTTAAPWLAAEADTYLAAEAKQPGSGLQAVTYRVGTNRFMRDTYFPSRPMRWDASQNRFVSVDLNPIQTMNPMQAQVLYGKIVQNMAAIRAWRPGAPPPIPGPQEFAKTYGLPVEKWAHFVHMVNYTKQLDYQMSQYAQMKAAGLDPTQATLSPGVPPTDPNQLPLKPEQYAPRGKKGKK